MLIAAIVLAILWWLVLALLAVFTANPVSLQYERIRPSDYVVTASVSDLESDRL